MVKWVAAIVLLVAIGGGAYFWSTLGNASAAKQSTVTLAVTQGDLHVTVQTNGTVAATREQAVTYQTTGSVVEVLVKSGDAVQAGQPLVRQTDADQKTSVKQAQAALDTAQAKLDDLKKGPTGSDVNSAKAAVAAAQAELDSVKAGSSKKDIADAQADLRSAEANLATLKSGATKKEIADADADLKAAQAAYDTLKAGATRKEIADADADLKAAQTAYNTVKAGATKEEIANAEADLQQAKAKYDALGTPPSLSTLKEAQSKLASAKAKLAALKAGPTASELSAAQLSVTQAQTSLKTIQNNAGLDKQKKELAMQKADRDLQQTQREYGTIADEVLDENGNFVYPTGARDYSTKASNYWAAYNTMKDAEATQAQAYADLQNALANEVQDVAAAQAKVDDAKKKLAEVQSGATPEELAAAQADVDTAQRTLDDLTAAPSKDDLATAQAAVTKAQSTLDQLKAGPTTDELAKAETTVIKAQTALDQLKAGPTAGDLAKAQTTVTKAQTTLDQLKAGPTASDLATAQTTVDKARDKLKDLLAGPTASDIAQAEATLATKQASLQALYDTASASEIASAEESVIGAQKNLASAQTDLDKTVLKAPFSGVVAEVTAEPNAEIKVGDTAVTIYDESGMHVELKVNESDIQKLKVGETSTITLDALAGKVFTGTVSTVSNVSQTSQDVVTYRVDVQFNPAGQPVKTGMSANAVVTVESHTNVIQVPTRALKTQGRSKLVEVIYGTDQVPVPVAVTTGATNSQMTEITGCVETGNQCLRAGDKVAVTVTASTTNNNTQQFPGAFPGGGFPGEGGGQFRTNPGGTRP